MRDSRETRSGVADSEVCRAAFCRARGVLVEGVGGVRGGKRTPSDAMDSREALPEVDVSVASIEGARGWKGRGERSGGEAGFVGWKLNTSDLATACSTCASSFLPVLLSLRW